MRLFTIRKEQLAVFGAAARLRDAARLRAHAREHFREQLATVPDPELDATLSRMADDAGTLGLSRRSDVLLFVNLSLALGEGFLSRPRHLWMRRMMSDESLGTPAERIRRLHAEAIERGLAA